MRWSMFEAILQGYDHWQELGNPGWSYQDVLPYFKKSEHSSRGADAYHGMDGELSVTDPTAPAAISQKFVDSYLAPGKIDVKTATTC